MKGVLKERRLTGGDEITGLEFDEWGIVRSQAWFYGRFLGQPVQRVILISS